jgi:Fungal specific transcription factor domain
LSSLQENTDLHSSEPTSEHGRVTFSSSVQYSVDFSQGFAEETDTFNFNVTRSRDLSLSSQLSTLQELLSPLSVSETSSRLAKKNGRVYPIELPKPSRLRYLLDVYFWEMDSFFPLLDQVDTKQRIFQALDALGYTDYELIVDVDVQYHGIIALLCNILVMGECMDPEGVDTEDSRPGWTVYIRGRKLIQQYSSLKDVDLDLVRYHTLNAIYMMNCELLQSASHAIATALQVAVIARLNDQSSWGECTPLEKSSRQKLWWTIYFLDRRIAQRNGSPYLIRDTEVAIEEFVPRGGALRETSDEDLSKSDTSNYFQALVNYGKLWGYIWDAFFAAGAKKRGDREEIEVTDTRILFNRKQLPDSLTWNTDMIRIYMANEESEPQVRRRLTLFIVGTIPSTSPFASISNIIIENKSSTHAHPPKPSAISKM